MAKEKEYAPPPKKKKNINITDARSAILNIFRETDLDLAI